MRLKRYGFAQLHCSQLQGPTTAKEGRLRRERMGTMLRKRREREVGRSVTLLQDARGPHRGAQLITGITLEMFTVRL